MAFPPLGNSDHLVVSVFIDFPINSKQHVVFHYVAHDYSRADLDGLCDYLRDVPWEDIFKFSASPAVSEFCEWVHVGIDVYIPYRKYQVKQGRCFTSTYGVDVLHRPALHPIFSYLGWLKLNLALLLDQLRLA